MMVDLLRRGLDEQATQTQNNSKTFYPPRKHHWSSLLEKFQSLVSQIISKGKIALLAHTRVSFLSGHRDCRSVSQAIIERLSLTLRGRTSNGKRQK